MDECWVKDCMFLSLHALFIGDGENVYIPYILDYMMIAETIECLTEVKPLPLIGKWNAMTDERIEWQTPGITAEIARSQIDEKETASTETDGRIEEVMRDSIGEFTVGCMYI
jgi:hypothetical protein